MKYQSGVKEPPPQLQWPTPSKINQCRRAPGPDRPDITRLDRNTKHTHTITRGQNILMKMDILSNQKSLGRRLGYMEFKESHPTRH